jgi:hypothetical protein
MTSPDFDPQLALERLLPFVDYALTLPMAIAMGETPELGDLLGKLFVAQTEQADILRRLIYDLYKHRPE